MNWQYYDKKFEYEESFNDLNWPWAGHKFFAYDLVRNIKPGVIVELGTHKGTSLFSFCQAVKDGEIKTEINAVDTWKGDQQAGFYGDEVFEEVKEIKNKYYKALRVKFWRMTFDEAVVQFEDNSIDVLHIDGLHTYEAVKHDFENWIKRIKPDGIVIFHDISVTRDDFGVYKLWRELKEKYQTMEFHHSYGLGVLFKSLENPILKRKKYLELRYAYQLEDIENKKIAEMIFALKQNGLELQQKDQELQQKDRNLWQKQQELSYLNLVTDDLNRQLQQKDQQLCQKDQFIWQKEQELSIIRNSLIWRTFTYSYGIYARNVQCYVPKIIFRTIDFFLYRSGLRPSPANWNKTSDFSDMIPNLDKCRQFGKNGAISFKAVEKPDVSIIIPVFNKWKFTCGCLVSLYENIGEVPSCEVIVVDDASMDETPRVIDRYFKNVRFFRNEKNFGFIGSCNFGAGKARGKYLVFLNNDTLVKKGWLENLYKTFQENENVGLVGSKLVYPDGRLQEAGGLVWKDGSAWNFGQGQDPSLSEFNYLREADYCSGASIMIPKRLFNEIGGFDRRYSPAYCEDSDLCFEVRKRNRRVLYQPASEITHFEGVSNGKDLKTGIKAYQVVNQKKFYEKWKDVLDRENFEAGKDVFLARDKSRNKKTVLVIDHYVPTFDKDAGSKSMYHFIRILRQLDYDVKFIGDNFCNIEPYTTSLEQLGVEVLYGSYYAANWMNWLAENGQYIDVAFISRPLIFKKYIYAVKSHTKAKIIYYGHDLHFLRTKREYDLTGDEKLLVESEEWKKMECDIMQVADISLYPSQAEIEEIERINPGVDARVLTPYMYDKELFAYNAENREGLLFVGGFSHRPNVDGILWFCKEIFPKVLEKISDLKLYIVGSNAPEEVSALNSTNVIVKGFLSDQELAELYGKVRVSVAPLRFGAGIKGKIIESLHNAVPMVTTSCGAEGIDNNVLEIADENSDFAKKIVSIYSDYEKLNRRSVEGKEFIDKNYSIDSVAKIIKEIFKC
jgi:GT2 family glycosyltransferase/glycosyltransferase involved in cell wall biosynthesis/predicted O-methyltransferase YrrM